MSRGTVQQSTAAPEVAPERSNGPRRGPTGSAPTLGRIPVLRLAVQGLPKVSEPHDPLEVEADQVSQRIVIGQSAGPISSLDGGPQRVAVGAEEEQIHRVAAGEPEEEVRRVAVGARKVDDDTVHGLVQRLAAARPAVSPRIAATLRNPSVGAPIPPSVRSAIEPGLGVGLGGVEVHDGAEAQDTASGLQARALTFGRHVFLGAGESPYDLPLMAHEATHVVQQGAFGPVADQVANTGQVQRLPSFITDELASYARHIPGFTLFTVIIGVNPITGETVERNAMTLVEGVMGLVPFGTAVFDKLVELGVIQEAFAFIDRQLATFDLSLGRVERLIAEAWEEMSLAAGFEDNLAILVGKFTALLDDLRGFVASLLAAVLDLIKDAVLDIAEQLLAENQAWALMKKVLRYDPLRGEPVEASTVEILEGFLRLIGRETELEQMRTRGTLQETADWIDTQIPVFQTLVSELGSLFTAAWDAIQPENLPDLTANIQALAIRAFTFLQSAWDFAVTVAAKVLEIVKDALLGWLSEFALKVPGFHLLTVILGRDPFTGEEVPRSAENIIRGFITLLPNGNATYDQLAESGVIGQAAANIEGSMAELGISWGMVTALFQGIWEGLSIDDLVDPIGAFVRITNQFGEPIVRLFSFVMVVIREVFTLILVLMNFPTDLLARIITNVVQAFEDIKRDPVAFLLNLLAAVKEGFSRFFAGILDYLLSGLTAWLFRGLKAAGIEPPTELTLESGLTLLMQVLGITTEKLWQKLAERIGQDRVDQIRGALDRLTGIWTFVRDVQEKGISAVWEYIQGQLSNLWGVIIQHVSTWIMEKIVVRVSAYLLSLIDPSGIMAVINGFVAFFNAIQSAIDYIRDMLEIVDKFVGTVAAVARGDIEPGAVMMEESLADAVPVAIGFLAYQVGLGNVGDKIAEIVAGLRDLVDQALDWLMDQAEQALESILGALGFGEEDEDEEKVDATDHVAVAHQVVVHLQETDREATYEETRDAIRARADAMQEHWNGLLGEGIGLTVSIEGGEGEAAAKVIAFEVLIAPNTTEEDGSVEFADTSEALSTWEQEAAETMNDYLNDFQNWRTPRTGVAAGHTRAVPVRLSEFSVERNRTAAERYIDQSPAGVADKARARDSVSRNIDAAAESEEETTVYRRLRAAATAIQDLYGGRQSFGLDVEHLTEVGQNPDTFVRTRISRKYGEIAARIGNGTSSRATEMEIINMSDPVQRRAVTRLYAEQVVEESLGDVGETLESEEPIEIELEIITEAMHKEVTAHRTRERAGAP